MGTVVTIERKPVKHLEADASASSRVAAINANMDWCADIDYELRKHDAECSEFRKEVRKEHGDARDRLKALEEGQGAIKESLSKSDAETKRLIYWVMGMIGMMFAGLTGLLFKLVGS